MNAEQKKIVARLQDNLFTIRQLAGWSAKDLGRLLDVTVQTIYNLERGKPQMSWIQYLAIRKILEIEIESQQDNKALSTAVSVLLDNDNLPDKEMEDLQKGLKTIAKGMSKSPDRAVALKLALQTVGIATASIAAGVLTKSPSAGINAWLWISNSMQEMKGRDYGENKKNGTMGKE